MKLVDELWHCAAYLEDFTPEYIRTLLLEAANEIQMLRASNELLKLNEPNNI